ncbi:Protein kinase C signaling pathway involved MAPKK protein [Coemansia erecta]|nr:Protein kinase C signaling pathway involved MAPKK protein [Coemansia sp. RSA 2618]KAJ2830755.1 Protein kinase C signaling pathway involved MAPKK protein [Coemansia erecta]
MASPLNRSNATTNRTVRPVPRLYTSTTPRGQAPQPILPRLSIPATQAGGLPRLSIPTTQAQPALPRLSIPATQTGGLPRLSIPTAQGPAGGDQAARQQSREVHNQGLSIGTPPVLAVDTSALAQPADIAGQLGALSLSSRTPGTARDEDDEYALSDENILVMRKLGEGSVGTVHKVEYLPRRKIMARKLMAVYPDETNHRQIMRELKLLKQCQSPYIVKFFGAFFSADDDGQSIAICMEYCEGGSLESVYKRVAALRAQIGEGVLGKVAVAVLNGLVHLHSYRVIHRDVKPSNILVTGRGEIKLCDFGVSGELVDSIAQTFVGTSYYMAPERIQGDRYAVQSDVWSLGLTLIEVSQNQFPFPPPGHPQLSVIELLEFIIHMPVPEMDATRFSSSCCDFVRQCLIKDPKDRPTPSSLLKHPFIVNAAAKKLDLKSWIERVWGVKK